MPLDREEIMRLAQFWAEVAEEHNVEKFATILHDDYVMWYNFDPVERTREEFIQTLKGAHAIFENQVNKDTRITIMEGGFVLQATMCGKLDGQDVSAPYCMIAWVKDGKVIRSDEYFDTAQLPKHAGRPGEMI